MTGEPQITNHEARKPALLGWPMIICWVGMLVFALHAGTHMVGAGDTWVAMACGRHFLNHGVDTVEPFSANSHKPGPTEEEIKTWPPLAQWLTDKVGIETVKYWHPTGWVNQNWLTHVIFYWLTHKSSFADADTYSFNTLVYWKFSLYIIAVICVYYTGRVLGANPALSAAFACFSMFIGRSFFDIRPAGFSNVLVAVFLLVLVLATYRSIMYIWLIVPVVVFWCNVHGGYIYAFIVLVPFVALHFLTSFSHKWFVSIGKKGVYHAIAAGLVSLLTMIVFNPFHLTNLTHTFVVSVSKHAERWRDVFEWHPAFAWSNPIGTAVPFLIMYIMAWLLLVGWAVVLMMARRLVNRLRRRKHKIAGDYQFPKIDLPLLAIVSLTIYMAIRSRRFIPVAAIAACPVLAMFIDQIVRAISAGRNFRKNERLTVSPMPRDFQTTFALVGTLTVVVLGAWWSLKFKRIYLDPWPNDTKFNSVFMRMTNSDVKPFYACKFIRYNKLSGKMFNYWTEGGFIAYGQYPDPNIGRTPLQLFMDGRAQAAYDRKTFDLWSRVMAGGKTAAQIMQAARARGHQLTGADYAKIGRALDKDLKNRDVWVALMPLGQFESPFVKGLERHRDWFVAFLNNKQKLLVDKTTPQGKRLYDNVFDGTALYPDEFSRNLVLAYNAVLPGEGKSTAVEGLDFAIKAFRLNPSRAPLQEIVLYARRFRQLTPAVYKFCDSYITEFKENRAAWSKKAGYRSRVTAALIACDYLQNAARAKKDTKLVGLYAADKREYLNEIRYLDRTHKW